MSNSNRVSDAHGMFYLSVSWDSDSETWAVSIKGLDNCLVVISKPCDDLPTALESVSESIAANLEPVYVA